MASGAQRTDAPTRLARPRLGLALQQRAPRTRAYQPAGGQGAQASGRPCAARSRVQRASANPLPPAVTPHAPAQGMTRALGSCARRAAPSRCTG